MKKGKKCLAVALVTALLLTAADTGINLKKADAATETVAYLEFLGGWGESYKYGTDSKAIADNAIIDGDGVYRLSLDFTQYDNYQNCAHGISNCIVRIKDGEALYGSGSHIRIRSVKVKNIDGEEKIADNIGQGYTFADAEGQTSLCLHSTYGVPQAKDIRTLPFGAAITPSESDYQLIDALKDENIRNIEVTFTFAKNATELAKIPANATPKPHTTANPDPTGTPETTATPQVTMTPNPWENPTATPNPWENPTATPQTTATPNPWENPTATPNPWEVPTPTPQGSATPGGTPAPSGNIVSNSTYTGQEKIFVNKSAFVVAAGGHASVTIALLRGAASATQVTASSGNSGIAVPTLQTNGKLDIAVPATAPAGGSTTVTLRFGSSSAAVKVTVSNPVTQIKGAKKSYTIKRKKTAKVSVNLTPKNKANAMTDTVTATISQKKVASVTSVKVSKNKASIKVKALKKGSAKLTVRASGKSASIKIKVK